MPPSENMEVVLEKYQRVLKKNNHQDTKAQSLKTFFFVAWSLSAFVVESFGSDVPHSVRDIEQGCRHEKDAGDDERSAHEQDGDQAVRFGGGGED